MKDALETLGTILSEDEGRDAIHLAVEPMIAVGRLYPGQHIGLVPGGAGQSDTPIGIVDPFLPGVVMPDDRFWLVLYPRTITSLRHVWAHPAFDDEPATRATGKEASEAWLRAFVERSDCPGYETVIARALEGPEYGDDFLLFRGQDAHGDIPPEFWGHVEIVTGQEIPQDRRPPYFSCSC